MKFYSLFLGVVFTSAAVHANMYCFKNCTNYRTNKPIKHIGCGDSGLFHLRCPTNAAKVPMTDFLKKVLVDVHNEKRNFIAGGGDTKHSAACRMATMEWDDELAYLAGINVKQCASKHDYCHTTDDFLFPGQNICEFPDSPPLFLNDSDLLRLVVEIWFDEVAESKQLYIDFYLGESFMENFAVMMVDRNVRFGCAASNFIRGDEQKYFVTCNYATTALPGYSIYGKCKLPGTSCLTGTNPQYPNLCSASEGYALNIWF